jgi:hypothetical protein
VRLTLPNGRENLPRLLPKRQLNDAPGPSGNPLWMLEMIESEPPDSSLYADEYYYRRPLTPRELLPAVGLGVGAGVLAFYLARVLLERTPLRPERRPSTQRPKPIIRRSAGE